VKRGVVVASWLWGVAVAIAVARFYFRYGPGDMHLNHEGMSYVYRVVEFLSCLRAGYAFPQWAVDFRQGLGSPYFGYYQPGFFYVASAFNALLPVKPAIGMTLTVFSVLGYGGLLGLVGRRFGTAAGVLAGTMLLLSQYSLLEIYFRGDLSEYCGMMMLPVVFHCLVTWMEHGSRRHWLGLAAACAVLVLMHPAAALLGYGMLGLAIVVYAAAVRAPRRAAVALGALLAGGGLAGFFWVPVALEWDLVHGDRAAINLYAYFFHFVDPWSLVLTARQGHTPVKIPPLTLALIGAATVALVVRRRAVSAAQWRLVGVLWLMLIVSAFMMGSASRPVWEVLPFLHRIQFPWRLMLVINVVAAALSGCTPALARTLAVLAIAASVWTSRGSTPLPWSYPTVETRTDILVFFARPDAVDEWIPRDARRFTEGEGPWDPVCDVPECRVRGFERAPGRLRAEVTTPVAASVTLPHYFFPVGWRATRDGAALPLERTDEGLMRVRVPAGDGVVELTFATTPMRRLGVAVSAATLVLLLGGTAWVSGRERRARARVARRDGA
jgi:hypothetical protein